MKVSALSRISEWISIQDIASAFENRPNEGRIGMIALWGCNTNGMAQQLTKFADVVVVIGGDQSSAGSGYVAEEKLPGIIRKFYGALRTGKTFGQARDEAAPKRTVLDGLTNSSGAAEVYFNTDSGKGEGSTLQDVTGRNGY